jgi:hypothetical protein
MLGVADAVAQSFRGPEMRQIEFGRVLHRWHDRDLRHAPQRLLDVRGKHTGGIDLFVVDEAIGSLELGGIERAWKRAVGTARKPSRQRDQPARQTGVAQIGRTEFGVGPVTVMVVVYRRRWRAALRELHAS